MAAAEGAEFRPQWFSSDYEKQVTDTVTHYEPLTDAWRLTASSCLQVEVAARAIDVVAESGNELTDLTFIEAMVHRRWSSGPAPARSGLARATPTTRPTTRLRPVGSARSRRARPSSPR